MVKVKTIKPHNNGYGQKFEKAKGDVYSHPNPSAEIKSGFVKEVKSNVVQGKGRGVSGNGTKSVSPKKHNSKSDGSTGNKKEPGTNKGTSKA